MKQSMFSLAISVLSVVVLFLPFTTNKIYDKRKKVWRRLSLKGWIIIACSSGIVVMTYKKDSISENKEQNQRTQDSIQKRKVDSVNIYKISKAVDQTTEKTTKVFYDQLIKIGLSKSQADSTIQGIYHESLKHEIKKLKSRPTASPLLTVTIRIDSLDFGVDEVFIDFTSSAANIININAVASVAAYEKGYISFHYQKSRGLVGTDLPLTQTQTLQFKFKGTYYVDCYVILVDGHYFDQFNNRFSVKNVYWCSPIKKKFGQLNSDWKAKLIPLFEKSERVAFPGLLLEN